MLSSTVHEYEILIKEHHLDSFGHVNNAVYLELFEEAYDIAEETGDRNRIALILTNLGETHNRLGNPHKAVDFLKKAEGLADELGDKLGLAEAARGLGKAYLSQREFTKARECTARAVDIFREIQSKVQLGVALRSLGEVTAAGSAGVFGRILRTRRFSKNPRGGQGGGSARKESHGLPSSSSRLKAFSASAAFTPANSRQSSALRRAGSAGSESRSFSPRTWNPPCVGAAWRPMSTPSPTSSSAGAAADICRSGITIGCAAGKSQPSLSRAPATLAMGRSRVRRPRFAVSAAVTAPPTSGPRTTTS